MVRATHITICDTTASLSENEENDKKNISLPKYTLLRRVSKFSEKMEKMEIITFGTRDNDDSGGGGDDGEVAVPINRVHLQEAYIAVEDVMELQFDRYVKNRKCAVYRDIPFSELEHARIIHDKEATAKVNKEYLVGHLKKGHRIALLEELEHGAWFHVVLDTDLTPFVAAGREQQKPDNDDGDEGNAQLSGDTIQLVGNGCKGYVLSYLIGKMDKIESMQLKPIETTSATGSEASSSSVSSPITAQGRSIDQLNAEETADDADVSESASSSKGRVRRRQRRKRRENQNSAEGSGNSRAPGSTFRARKFEEMVSNMRTTYDADINTYQFQFPSIGIFHSCFPEKNGTPRQGNLSPFSKGKLVVTIPNARQSLEGLEEYSHVWLLFVFHLNTATRYQYNHPKIKPPRLDHGKVGVFSTRSPHRPNPIGLTAARIDRIVKDTVYLSGVDLVHGTPVLDIKPYIPHYDSFGRSQINVNNNLEQERYFGRQIIDTDAVTMPEWIQQAPEERIQSDNIVFEEEALHSLERLVPKLEYFTSFDEIKLAIIHVIRTDPRPAFMKGKGRRQYKLYGFRIDKINVRCSIQDDGQVVVKIIERWLE